tara:strand:+ start:4650 stop:6473 length:1824 start_codon:yes stop_codon:yes gene_type:complete
MTQWIAGITRGHNGGCCLLKDGKIEFAIEEERFTRHKYDSAPLYCMMKIKEHIGNDILSSLVVAHTQPLHESSGKLEYSNEDVYTGWARKLGLIDRDTAVQRYQHGGDNTQVIDVSKIHHKLHAACAFYRSGFESAVSLIVDGAGAALEFGWDNTRELFWEVESIYGCNYPAEFNCLYKHAACSTPVPRQVEGAFDNSLIDPYEKGKCMMILDSTCGITKSYEAVTQYCGFPGIEAGKTMGLSPYGKSNDKIPALFPEVDGDFVPSNTNIFLPSYPQCGIVNEGYVSELLTPPDIESEDLTRLQNRRDMAYAIQKETAEQMVNLIRMAVEASGNPNVVLSGGYGLNCVSNYYYKQQLEDEGINLYVEPISSDAGTAVGAALLQYHRVSSNKDVKDYSGLYLGPKYNYTNNDIESLSDKYAAEIIDTNDKDVVELITNKNIVALFQGRSEAGPRALGNRSLLYDPTDPKGKDIVNKVKRREYFRPFAGSILEEHVHDWFDLVDMDDTPYMMYAVKCREGVEEKIPSIIHVDGTCRIQTVNKEQNENYYNLIKEFFEQTGCPIVFNTSFNLGGEALVETLEDALYTLANSDIEYLYLPEFGKLITIKND